MRELLQMDGSHHDWLEGRGPHCVLMAYIDDASSRVWARFYKYEGTVPAMDSFGRYVKQHGIPLAVYADKHTTYKSPAQPTVEEQLAGVAPQSQFERSLAELGVELIHAHSPQGQGTDRTAVEHLPGSAHQGAALARIATLVEANQFLDAYLLRYNQRFAVPSAHPTDLHRPGPPGRDLDRILCCKSKRVLRRDWTVAHHGQLYQIFTTMSGPRRWS